MGPWCPQKRLGSSWALPGHAEPALPLSKLTCKLSFCTVPCFWNPPGPSGFPASACRPPQSSSPACLQADLCSLLCLVKEKPELDSGKAAKPGSSIQNDCNWGKRGWHRAGLTSECGADMSGLMAKQWGRGGRQGMGNY